MEMRERNGVGGGGGTREGSKRGRHLFSNVGKQGFLINPIF